MFFAYVLKSVQHEFYYKGHCQDLEIRLRQHNAGMTQSIRHYIPFEVAYFEKFETEDTLIDCHLKHKKRKLYHRILFKTNRKPLVENELAIVF
ncbi:MAG: GIY-YIG nuclease family protein [Bacteroidetes bacterium]|nr:GIY-YIG nuclease family protein [Bacteroidota bacterium]